MQLSQALSSLVELGSPFCYKGLTSLPDSFSALGEADNQLKKEFGFSPDELLVLKITQSTVYDWNNFYH